MIERQVSNYPWQDRHFSALRNTQKSCFWGGTVFNGCLKVLFHVGLLWILFYPGVHMLSFLLVPFMWADSAYYTPLQGSDNKRATHIFWKGPWWKPRILTFEIAPLYRFWENRDVILHVKSMGENYHYFWNCQFYMSKYWYQRIYNRPTWHDSKLPHDN